MLNPKDKQVLADLKMVTDTLDFPLLVIGAGARWLIFDQRMGIEGRATTDWDVAIRVQSWSEYEMLSERMTQAPGARFKQTKIPHKFIHLFTEREVDLVPFGAIGQPNQEIKWPDGNKMNLLGLQEAFNCASLQNIDGLELQVVDIPAFLVLKLFAWGDRKATKDLEDIAFILEHYQDDNRVFENLSTELGESIIKFEDAAIVLLAQDIKQIFVHEALMKLDELLSSILQNQDRLIPQLISRNMHGSDWDDSFSAVVHRLEILRHEICDHDPDTSLNSFR